MHRPKGVLNQPFLALVYDYHIAVVVQIVLYGKDGQHFGPVTRPSVTVLVVVFHRGFAALRVDGYDVIDGRAEVGIGLGNNFGDRNAVINFDFRLWRSLVFYKWPLCLWNQIHN